MERELRLERSEDQHPVVIDIRKILEQMGLQQERWPQEWQADPEQITLG